MVEELSDAARDRRTVLSGLAATGIGLPLVAACGAAASSSGSALVHQQQRQSKTGKSTLTPLVKTSQVPVGGGVILADAVVTQPTAGEFKAFSPVCTHQGCTVTQVQNQQILCPCHGSVFSISTGAVEGGPAPSPLPPIGIVTKNGEVYAT